MILKDLFDKITFDEIYPYLLPLIPGREDNAHNFREAYDLIRLYEPKKGLVDKLYVEDLGSECTNRRYIIRYVDGAPWPNELAKTVVYEKDGEFNEAQVLATCLWEMTFYGFSEEEITNEGDELGLFWEPEVSLLEAAERMDHKWYENWSVRMNRSKRKRLYRQKRSARRLHKRAMREQLLRRMGLAFPREEIIHLMDMEKGHEYLYRSAIADGDERLPYILKSIKDYQRIGDLDTYEAAYFWLHVPTNFPFPEEPWLAFQRELTDYLGMSIRFGIVQKEASTDEVGGFLLLFKQSMS